MSQADETPVRTQTPWDLVFQELGQMKTLCQNAADHAADTNALVTGLVARVERVEKKQAAREVGYNWAPLVFSALAFVGMLWTLSLVIHHG